MSTMPRTEATARRPAQIALALIVLYIAVDTTLALLRNDLSLIHNAESDYGRGPDDWLMDTNFIVRGAFSALAILALRDRRIVTRRWPLWLIGVWAGASALLAFFPDNPPGYRHEASGTTHLVLAFIAFTAIAIAAIAITMQLPDGVRPSWIKPACWAATVLAAIAYLALPRTLNRTHSAGGLIERIFLGSVLIWLALVLIATLDAIPSGVLTDPSGIGARHEP